MRYVPSRALTGAIVVLCSGGLAAQSVETNPKRIQPGTTAIHLDEVEPDFPLATPASAVETTATPLTLGGKANYFVKSAVSPQTLSRVALTTGFGHALGADPWGGGMDGYSDRLRSRYYEHLTRRGVQFAIGAARGEDPRFFRSGKEGFWDRTKFVLGRTVVTQMDDGRTSIAVGKLAGIAGANYASVYWRPDDPSPWKHTLSNTGFNVAGDVGMRMLREFWPDLKRKFKK